MPETGLRFPLFFFCGTCCCQDFLPVTVGLAAVQTDARTSGRRTAFACAARAPARRVRARRVCSVGCEVPGVGVGPGEARGSPRCAEFFVELGTSARVPNEA